MNLILLLIFNCILSESFSISPFFRQNLKDKPIDWININNQSHVIFGDFSTDIEEITYHSNGQALNTTLWLTGTFKENPLHSTILNYGMMIDADLDKNTGVQGIDYQYEIQWNNESSVWSLTLYEYSSSGKSKILKQVENYTNFYQPHSNFINLYVDLKEILFPQVIDILFYAESLQNNSLITDFTEWVRIPPPNIEMFIPSVVLRQGESKIINLNINSTNLEPTIQFYFKDLPKDLNIEYDYNTIKLPKYGFASIPLKFSVNSNASIMSNTIFVFANVTFPEIEFLESQHYSFIPQSLIQRETMSLSNSFLVTINPKLSVIEYVGTVWKEVGDPIVFFYGILAGLSPWLFNKLKNKFKKQ